MKTINLSTKKGDAITINVKPNNRVISSQIDLFNEDNFNIIHVGHEGMEGIPFTDYACSNNLIFRRKHRTWLRSECVEISNKNYLEL